MRKRFWLEDLTKKDHAEDVSTSERTILHCNLSKFIRYSWLRTQTSDGLL
jgi:hypothetical protein